MALSILLGGWRHHDQTSKYPGLASGFIYVRQGHVQVDEVNVDSDDNVVILEDGEEGDIPSARWYVWLDNNQTWILGL